MAVSAPASARCEEARPLALRGLVAWAMIVAVSAIWGSIAVAPRPEVKVPAAPLFGHWGWYAGRGMIVPVVAAALVVALGPRVAERARWPTLLVATALASPIWAVSLALSDGWSRVTGPLRNPDLYEPFARTIDDPGQFLATFTERLTTFDAVHVRGHPPGAPLLALGLDRVGLGSVAWWAVLLLAGWGLAAAATLAAARAFAGDHLARRAAPGVVLVPGALWAITGDGLFAGVGALAVALAVGSILDGATRRAAIAGVCFAAALLLTYGAAVLAVIPIAVAVRRRGWLPLAVAAVAALGCLVVLWAATGFWWLDGLAATRREYWAGVASHRPSLYFALAGNPGALALTAGPAVVAGLWCLRRAGPHTALLPGAAVAAVVLADASLLSKAEVERIWLLFVPWLALSTAALPDGWTRRWLALQATTTLVLWATLRGDG